MDLVITHVRNLLGTSFGRLINQYITLLFRTTSTRLENLLDTSSGKLTNQYLTSLFITKLTIGCMYLRVVV